MDTELVARLRAVIPRLARVLNDTSTGEDLTPTQYSVLALVRVRGPLGLTELTELEGLNPTMLSRIVKVLDERGLIRRMPDPGDLRAARVAATEAGEQSKTNLNEAWRRLPGVHRVELAAGQEHLEADPVQQRRERPRGGRVGAVGDRLDQRARPTRPPPAAGRAACSAARYSSYSSSSGPRPAQNHSPSSSGQRVGERDARGRRDRPALPDHPADSSPLHRRSAATSSSSRRRSGTSSSRAAHPPRRRRLRWLSPPMPGRRRPVIAASMIALAAARGRTAGPSVGSSEIEDHDPGDDQQRCRPAWRRTRRLPHPEHRRWRRRAAVPTPAQMA